MKYKIKKIASLAAPLLVGSLTTVASAQSNTPSAPITTVQQLVDLICKLFGYMFFAAVALSMVMGIYAAFTYMTAQGDSEKVSKASKTLTYVAIGIGVALLAKALPTLVADLLGGDALTSC